MNTQISPHIWLPEAKLSFHPEKETDVDIHPLRGLVRFGPHSEGLVPGPIRIATIAPSNDSQKLYDFISELRNSYKPRERAEYLPPWPGFPKVFGVDIRAASKDCHIKLDNSLQRDFDASQTPHLILAERLLRAIQVLETRRAEFDVLFLYIPQQWARGFRGGVSDDFDLHDHIKALTAARRLPIQLVREDKAISYPCRASVMWRVGLAIYAKAGGVPWKLADTDAETAYMGISYAVRPVESNKPRFVTCCSQVFDGEGSGLEFLAYDAHEIEIQRENPFMSRTEMFRLMTRSLDLYQRRHAGRSPRRVIVHKSTEFKKDEIDGCMEALHLCESVDLIQVVEDIGWRGIHIEQSSSGEKGKPAPYPMPRGTLLPLGQQESLLWIHGDVKGVVADNKSYFQGKRSTPQPIKLVRHAGHGPWDDTASSVLALSKMNWNNDALYDQLPVTMAYAQVLARILKRMDGLGSTPYQFRFFM